MKKWTIIFRCVANSRRYGEERPSLVQFSIWIQSVWTILILTTLNRGTQALPLLCYSTTGTMCFCWLNAGSPRVFYTYMCACFLSRCCFAASYVPSRTKSGTIRAVSHAWLTKTLENSKSTPVILSCGWYFQYNFQLRITHTTTLFRLVVQLFRYSCNIFVPNRCRLISCRLECLFIENNV